MTTAQLQLPFTQATVTPSTHSSRSQEKPKSTRRSVRIEELLRPEQDDDIIRMAHAFADDVDLNESVDDYTVRMSCIALRADVERRGVNVFIAYDDDRAIGLCLGVTSPAFHRPGVVAEQKLWYVEPTHRGSVAARKLMAAYERWARCNGATQIFTGTANKRYAERTSQLLEKLGYARVGNVHVKEI